MVKCFKIGKWWFYVSDRRMRMPKSENKIWRERRFQFLRRVIYNDRGAHCEECGKYLPIDGYEVHHLIPVSKRPDLMCSLKNLQLLCPECHSEAHKRSVRVERGPHPCPSPVMGGE